MKTLSPHYEMNAMSFKYTFYSCVAYIGEIGMGLYSVHSARGGALVINGSNDITLSAYSPFYGLFCIYKWNVRSCKRHCIACLLLRPAKEDSSV